MNDIHANKLGHTRSMKKNIKKVQQMWCGIPRKAIETYLLLLPQCTIDSKKTKKQAMSNEVYEVNDFWFMWDQGMG
jgi:hypothetical protein